MFEGTYIYEIINLIISICVFPLTIGYINYIFSLINGNDKDSLGCLFSKYKKFGLIASSKIVVSLSTLLWCLLFLVPGIIYALKMAMVSYIIADDDSNEMTTKEITNKSQEMMEGHKEEYFILMLSFACYIILGAFTLGIAYIWIIPYIKVAQSLYYQELLKEYNNKNVITSQNVNVTPQSGYIQSNNQTVTPQPGYPQSNNQTVTTQPGYIQSNSQIINTQTNQNINNQQTTYQSQNSNMNYQ